jgi:hypothetical protein
MTTTAATDQRAGAPGPQLCARAVTAGAMAALCGRAPSPKLYRFATLELVECLAKCASANRAAWRWPLGCARARFSKTSDDVYEATVVCRKGDSYHTIAFCVRRVDDVWKASGLVIF